MYGWLSGLERQGQDTAYYPEIMGLNVWMAQWTRAPRTGNCLLSRDHGTECMDGSVDYSTKDRTLLIIQRS